MNSKDMNNILTGNHSLEQIYEQAEKPALQNHCCESLTHQPLYQLFEDLKKASQAMDLQNPNKLITNLRLPSDTQTLIGLYVQSFLRIRSENVPMSSLADQQLIEMIWAAHTELMAKIQKHQQSQAALNSNESIQPFLQPSSLQVLL